MQDIEIGKFISDQLQFVRRRYRKPQQRKSIDWWLRKVQLLEAEEPGKTKSNGKSKAQRN